MSKSILFYYGLLSFLAGVVFACLTPVPLWGIAGAFGCSTLFFIVARWWRTSLIIAVILFCAALGSFRVFLALPSDDGTHISAYTNVRHAITGVIRTEPDIRDDQVRYTLTNITIDQSAAPVSGDALVRLPSYPRYAYGDVVAVSCMLRAPEPVEDFRYDFYLRRYGIYATCTGWDAVKVAEHQGNRVMDRILAVKSFILSKLQRILPEPHASFMGGILLGARQSIPADVKETFRITGTAHIVAVSGYNVTLLVAFCMGTLGVLGIGRKKGFWIASAALVLFVLITGAQASIVRAGIMGEIVLFARYIGRPTKVRNSLALAAAGMAVANPWVVLYDAGFQLSFLATIGLVYIQPLLVRWFAIERIPWKAVKESVSEYVLTTVSAIIATTPLLAYQFHSLSIIAPLANILVLPVIALAMALGFAAIAIALLYLPAGQIAAWGGWLVLEYVLRVLRYLSSVPFATIEITVIPIGAVILAYAGMLAVIWLSDKKRTE